MLIKFKSNPSELNNKFYTGKIAREFMKEQQNLVQEAVRHNMNYYRVLSCGLFIHVYDAYEVV